MHSRLGHAVALAAGVLPFCVSGGVLSPTTPPVSTAQLLQLQTYVDAFKTYMTSSLNPPPGSSNTSLLQIQNYYDQYEGWIDAWLSQALGPSKQSIPYF